MGVTKQAAQKRFVPRQRGRRPAPRRSTDFTRLRRTAALGLFRRFTPRARSVVHLGPRRQALELGYAEVLQRARPAGPDSADPDSVAAKAIVELGRQPRTGSRGRPRRARAAANASGWPACASAAAAKKTLELSLREALHLGHNYIGTEHLLLGLLRNEKDRAAQLLSGLGVTWERAEQPSSPTGRARPRHAPEQNRSRGTGTDRRYF